MLAANSTYPESQTDLLLPGEEGANQCLSNDLEFSDCRLHPRAN